MRRTLTIDTHHPATDRADFRAALVTALAALVLVVAAEGTAPASGMPDWHGNVMVQGR